MGRKKERKKDKRERNKNGKSGAGYEDIIRENADFEKYYKVQKICPEEDWQSFMSSLRESLPASFRITGSRSQAKALLRIIQSEYFQGILAGTTEAEEKVKPVSLPWHPNNLAWQLNLTRRDIRKSEAYMKLHNFLMAETESGNISRQESVSMIPPLVLDIKPYHKVLDMCAAPGSKTAQMIELLHVEEGKLPEGFVVANDCNNKRCYMLVHQAKRIQSPCIIITNHDASVFPNIVVNGGDSCQSMLKFDRILCDVPCSGDGTLRKNFDIWKKWKVASGNNLHGSQLKIVRRGAELLAVGGKMVYSTCSLNPVEDEAVIHHIIVETEGALQLVDIKPLLPGLKYKEGMTSWVPMSSDLVGYTNFEQVPENKRTHVRPSMFPPKSEEAETFSLHRCIRVLPHLQDTGGFFVAVLEKLKLLPWEQEHKSKHENSSGSPTEDDTTKERAKSPPRKKMKFNKKMQGYREDPFFFLEPDEPIWPSICNFYKLSSDLDPTLFLTRCKEGKKKNIYFTSPAVRDLVQNNDSRIKIINTGIKAFVRCDNKGTTCDFRLAQEGAHIILTYMEGRRLQITCQDMIAILMKSDLELPLRITSLESTTQEQLQKLDNGSVALVYEHKPDITEDENAEGFKIELVGWKGKTSVRAYVPKNDRIHFLRLCGADVSKFEVNKFKEKEGKPKEGEEEVDDNPVEEGEDNCLEVGQMEVGDVTLEVREHMDGSEISEGTPEGAAVEMDIPDVEEVREKRNGESVSGKNQDCEMSAMTERVQIRAEDTVDRTVDVTGESLTIEENKESLKETGIKIKEKGENTHKEKGEVEIN